MHEVYIFMSCLFLGCSFAVIFEKLVGIFYVVKYI